MNKDELKYKSLIKKAEAKGLGWGIKFTRKNGDSWADKYPTVNYKVGKTIEIKDATRNNEDCGRGLHLGKDFIGAGNYNLPEKIFFCTYDKKDVCGSGDDKVRVSKLKVECELPRWMGYGKNGKKILAKIGKKINPEKYNPYQATKLPSKTKFKPFYKKLDQVWGQVGDQVGDQVWDQVGDQVGDQVWDQVGDQVRDQVRGQVGDQVRGQVGDQVWGQVGGQVWATSYWAVNIHFNLGIKHWLGNFLKLGVMIVFVQGKVKVFGKKGKFLGEYEEKELL